MQVLKHANFAVQTLKNTKNKLCSVNLRRYFHSQPVRRNTYLNLLRRLHSIQLGRNQKYHQANIYNRLLQHLQMIISPNLSLYTLDRLGAHQHFHMTSELFDIHSQSTWSMLRLRGSRCSKCKKDTLFLHRANALQMRLLGAQSIATLLLRLFACKSAGHRRGHFRKSGARYFRMSNENFPNL